MAKVGTEGRVLPLKRRRLLSMSSWAISSVKADEDDFEVNDKSSGDESDDICIPQWRSFVHFVADIAGGYGATNTHDSNFLHALATLTTLCCVDKKGILSWPSPSADKVFFLTSREGKVEDAVESPYLQPENAALAENLTVIGSPSSYKRELIRAGIETEHVVIPEILDVTRETIPPWSLHFDDVTWKRFENNLKPLGLAILLNTCHEGTRAHYRRFFDHVTCHSLHSTQSVSVANRRCLCELSYHMGFQHSVVKGFELNSRLCAYKKSPMQGLRQQPEEDVKNDELNVTAVKFKKHNLKFPLAHMMSVVVRQKDAAAFSQPRFGSPSLPSPISGQLFTQGTGDIILECCVDFWQGESVLPLTLTTRKMVLDFYQRCSLTGYCTAFSYKPLIGVPGSSSPSSRPLFKHLSLQDYYMEFSNGRRMDLSTAHRLFNEEERRGKEDEAIDLLESQWASISDQQIFLGMISMQYQALNDIVRLIEELDKACIRFVHFSKENELRSKIFSEKMGLESGWNCHISLLPDGGDEEDHVEGVPHIATSEEEEEENLSMEGVVDKRGEKDAGNNSSNASIFPKIKFKTVNLKNSGPVDKRRECYNSEETGTSSVEEENVAFVFDISNRAKLPRGVEAIKPHLENVDNVPLLVSLFTDCKCDTTQGMLAIMQQYEQIICVLGSSANMDNYSIFTQVQASIGIEPLYPDVCCATAVDMEDESAQRPGITSGGSNISLLHLSQLLNSFSCSATLQRENPLPIYRLIATSRNVMSSVWNCVQFWLCCTSAAVVIQLLALIFTLPAIFTFKQCLWISCFIIPLLSTSLVGSNWYPDRIVMEKSAGKDWLCHIDSKLISYAVWCYGTRLVLPIVCTLIYFAIAAFNISEGINRDCGFPGDGKAAGDKSWFSFIFYPKTLSEDERKCGKMDKYWSAIGIARHHAVLLLFLHFVSLSASFLHRQILFWSFKVKWFTCIWTLFVISTCLAHFCYYVAEYGFVFKLNENAPSFVVTTIFLFTPVLTFLWSEFVKFREISEHKRYQKKVRLEFGTKLGMNSPF